jgi:hypothetical protein
VACKEWADTIKNYKYIKVQSMKCIIYRNDLDGGSTKINVGPLYIAYEGIGGAGAAQAYDYILQLPYSKVTARD